MSKRYSSQGIQIYSSSHTDQNDKQKQVETYVNLKRQAGDKRPQRELELEAIEVVYKPRTIETENPNQAVAKATFLSSGGINKILTLQEEIASFEGKKIKIPF